MNSIRVLNSLSFYLGWQEMCGTTDSGCNVLKYCPSGSFQENMPSSSALVCLCVSLCVHIYICAYVCEQWAVSENVFVNVFYGNEFLYQYWEIITKSFPYFFALEERQSTLPVNETRFPLIWLSKWDYPQLSHHTHTHTHWTVSGCSSFPPCHA